jgi:hypothetical protein
MTNAKLVALFKQFPWLAKYKEAIGNPSVVKVQLLDTSSINRWCGKVVTIDDNYFIDGHFFDHKGGHLGMVNPASSVGFWAWLQRALGNLPTRQEQSIAQAATCHPNCDLIRYVAVWGHDLNHYGSFQLYLYKVPREKTVSSLLQELTTERNQKQKADLLQATEELEEEVRRTV